MLFPLFSGVLSPTASSASARAAIKCLLAYTHGLEDCHIDVEISGGVVTLTGTAPCEQAARDAAAVVADFFSAPVYCRLEVVAL